MRTLLFVFCVLLVASCAPIAPQPQTVQQDSQPNVEIQQTNEQSEVKQPNTPKEAETISIANWNLHVYGNTKASNPDLVAFYAEKMSAYNIIFVQEVRDSDGEAFDILCDAMPRDYTCTTSVPAGAGSYKEQYGLIYRENIEVTEWNDLAEDENMYELWARPPLIVTFSVDNYTFTAWNIHIAPDDVEYELGNLYSNVLGEGNIIVLGDFNADCSYYKPEQQTLFEDWTWVIGDDDDTNVADTSCAYDRILLNEDAGEEFIDGGVDNEGITPEVSDHYMVWAELAAKE
jgi:endonuclease/exonuclease/phosphatase family metal-dependent hydrolase